MPLPDRRLLLLPWLPLIASVAKASTLRHRHVQSYSCDVVCHVVHPEILVEDKDHSVERDEVVHCVTQLPGNSFRSALSIELPPLFLKQHSEFLEQGSLHVCIQDATVQHGSVLLGSEPEFEVLHTSDQRRKLNVATTGTKRLLAVRITTEQERPDETLEFMEGTIFGTGDQAETHSVVSQYAALTHGQLQYVKAEGPNIVNGVTEVRIQTSSLVGKDVQGNLKEDILTQTEDLLGDLEDVADNIIFCLPTGSLFNDKDWTAFTYLFEPYSYYQKSRCTRLSVVAHELGHSLGFQHSGVGDSKYADKSGYMGFAINHVGRPLKAFNGQKHWFSGWFQDRAVQVDPNRVTLLKMVGFVDYSSPNFNTNDVVLIKVENVVLQYNIARGYNIDTEKPNRVTVSYARTGTAVSSRLADLGGGDSYVYTYLDNNSVNKTVILEVCSLVTSYLDYATVSIHPPNKESGCLEWNAREPLPSTLTVVAPPSSAPVTVSQTTNAPTIWVPPEAPDEWEDFNDGEPLIEDEESPPQNKGFLLAMIGVGVGAGICCACVSAYILYLRRSQKMPSSAPPEHALGKHLDDTQSEKSETEFMEYYPSGWLDTISL